MVHPLGRFLPVVVIVCGLAAGRPAAAGPMFFFQATSGTTMQAEVIGDAGGSNYLLTNGWPAGQGLPTVSGSWPTPAPGFAPDVSFSGSAGISGYHTANLYLSSPAYVQFQFMGKGDALYFNQFKVNGTVVYSTATSGSNPTAPYYFPGGLVPFSYVANVNGQGGTATYTIVNGSNTANPQVGAAFFLGFDPYTSGTTFITSGTGAVYIGLSDRPEAGAAIDHDFQDLTVKVTIVGVPEPQALVLAVLGAAGAAIALSCRRMRSRRGSPRGGGDLPRGDGSGDGRAGLAGGWDGRG